MNSSVNPSSELSNSFATEPTTSEPTKTGEPAANGFPASRQEPIPPPSEPMQYRAIGLARGRYSPSAEQFTQGTLVACDGTEINAVLLGRIISLVKNHLELEKEHLWVVYPRTGQKDDKLHFQIVGVWEPEKLNKELLAAKRPTPEEQLVRSEQVRSEQLEDSSPLSEVETSGFAYPSPVIEDGYFSVRGEVVYQSASDQNFFVKIKQAPRQDSDKPKYFKLKLQGDLATKAVGQFWDLQARRQAEDLVFEQGEAIAVLLSKKPKPRKKQPPRQGGYSGTRRNLDTPHPVRKAGDSKSMTRPAAPRTPSPKPIKRQKPPQ